MAGKLQANGTDLSSIFKPRINAARANVSLLSGGVDIATIFEKTTLPNDTPVANTNLQTASTDIRNLFQDISYVTPSVTPSITPTITPTITPSITPTITPSSSISLAVSITNQTVVDTNTAIDTVRYQLASDGTVNKRTTTGGAGYTFLETWLVAGTNSDFEARISYVSGNGISGGADGALGTGVGSWWALSTSREWTFTAAGIDAGPVQTTCTIEIRLAASPFTVLDSCTIDMTAERTS